MVKPLFDFSQLFDQEHGIVKNAVQRSELLMWIIRKDSIFIHTMDAFLMLLDKFANVLHRYQILPFVFYIRSIFQWFNFYFIVYGLVIKTTFSLFIFTGTWLLIKWLLFRTFFELQCALIQSDWIPILL